MPTVRLPGVLDPASGGRRRVGVSGTTVAQVLDDLCRGIPEIRVHLFDETGGLRPHVLVMLDGVDRRRQLDTALGPEDEVVILQAVSGGAAPRQIA